MLCGRRRELDPLLESCRSLRCSDQQYQNHLGIWGGGRKGATGTTTKRIIHTRRRVKRELHTERIKDLQLGLYVQEEGEFSFVL